MNDNAQSDVGSTPKLFNLNRESLQTHKMSEKIRSLVSCRVHGPLQDLG